MYTLDGCFLGNLRGNNAAGLICTAVRSTVAGLARVEQILETAEFRAGFTLPEQQHCAVTIFYKVYYNNLLD